MKCYNSILEKVCQEKLIVIYEAGHEPSKFYRFVNHVKIFWCSKCGKVGIVDWTGKETWHTPRPEPNAN